MDIVDQYYSSLMEKDSHLKDVLFDYCTGGDTTMREVESAFKEIKPDIKALRKEALRLLKEENKALKE